ncbi:MAG: hypothetical protein II434_05080 [Bacteroidales bacterium]|nr:hypothetical protein [Bacteroidales bacterium]
MSKIFKIVGWVLGILGIILGIICLSTSGGNVDVLLRYTYFLLIAAVVILVGLVILMAAKTIRRASSRVCSYWSASLHWC